MGRQLILPPRFNHAPPPADTTTEKHEHVGRKGDLVIELHSGDFGDDHKAQPALYIHHFSDEKRGAFVKLSDMWMFAEREAFHELIPPLAAQIYGFVTAPDLVRVMDAILDFLDDLRKAPPPPKFKHKSLDAFLESCAEEGVDFFVDINGKRMVGDGHAR